MEQKLDNSTDPSGGSNLSRVRAYNERLVLTLVRRHGSLPKAEIAKRTGLSAQTVSVIMRALEHDGLLLRGEPQRGKVGQPSIPMSLEPEGVFSIGLKIGRRSADMVLLDFLGQKRDKLSDTYSFPSPDGILEFARHGIEKFSSGLNSNQRARISGIGVATPFELWNWAEKFGASKQVRYAWENIDLKKELTQFCDFPVFVENDATAACSAELIFGRGSELSDFVYFFVGTFIGGGIVLNHSVYSGRTGNAGALGSMPILSENGKSKQLIDYASIYELEKSLKKEGIDPSPLWVLPEDWSGLGSVLDRWIDVTAKYIGHAIAASCSVIDFKTALIDGGFPPEIRSRLVSSIQQHMQHIDFQGIEKPQVLEASVGSGARAMGGASLPLFSRYLLDQNVLFKMPA